VASYKTIPVNSIHIGERLRPIDGEYALAISASMAERGLINPITVRATPAANGGKTPYTLVAGGYRHRGAELNQWQDIDAIVVAVDAVEAQLIEISENLYRNELNPLDRALFVLKFRELWEEKNGKVARGGDRKSKDTECPLIFTPGRKLSNQVQERLGFGETTYKKVTRIGQNLRPELRQAVRGTPTENDQSKLLKLAKMEPEAQIQVAAALREGADLATILSWTKPPKPKVDRYAAMFVNLVNAWDKADDDTRRRFLDHIGENADFSFLEAAQ
jgi:ParB family chromosome partitioning protein